MRFAFVACERTNYPVRLLCRLMEVSTSGFHDYLRRLAEPSPDPDAALREDLRAIHAHSRRRIKGSQRPRSGQRRDGRPPAENLLDRQFSVDSGQPAWVGDITYLATREGWMYLAAVINLQTRQVLGYSLSDRMPDTWSSRHSSTHGRRPQARQGCCFTLIAAPSPHSTGRRNTASVRRA